MVFTMTVACIVCLFTTDENPVRPELVSPLVHRFIPKRKRIVMKNVEYKAVNKMKNVLPNQEDEECV